MSVKGQQSRLQPAAQSLGIKGDGAMKALATISGVLILVLAVQAETLAQPPARVGHVRPLWSVQSLSGLQPVPYFIPNPNYYHHHASTAAESYARGLAAVTYARGQYNLLNAQARLVHADAYGQEIANHELAAQTYFAMRQTNREARAAERGPRATQVDLVRFAAQAKPDRLSPSELTNTGKISWPMLLQADEFTAFRAELERAFARRAANGNIGLEDHVRVSETAKVMLEVLKAYAGGVDPMDYVAARRFIESLTYEARQPIS
jgi:hypothetical protein